MKDGRRVLENQSWTEWMERFIEMWRWTTEQLSVHKDKELYSILKIKFYFWFLDNTRWYSGVNFMLLILDVRGLNQVGCMQNKHATHCSITLAQKGYMDKTRFLENFGTLFQMLHLIIIGITWILLKVEESTFHDYNIVPYSTLGIGNNSDVSVWNEGFHFQIIFLIIYYKLRFFKEQIVPNQQNQILSHSYVIKFVCIA